MRQIELRYLADNVVTPATGVGPAVQLENVISGTPKIVGDLPILDGATQNQFSPGDVLFAKLRPYLSKSLKVDKPLRGSGEFLCMRPNRLITPEFLTYVTLSQPWLDHAVMSSYGMKMPRTSWEHMANLKIPVFSLEEQWRITNFLDDCVSRIDRIISARRAQAELVSSLPWLRFGEMLANVAPIPLRRAIESISDGPFGSAFSSSDYVDSGPAVIRLGNIGFGKFRDREIARVPNSIYRKFTPAQVQPGDLLIASLGDSRNHVGRACVAPPDLGQAMVKGKCFRARVDHSVASEHFLAILLSSPIGAESLVQQGTGSTRSMLNFERLLSCRLPIPDLTGQKVLVSSFGAEEVRAASAANDLELSASLFTKYKSSLITAAVTGGFNVTTAGSTIPEWS